MRIKYMGRVFSSDEFTGVTDLPNTFLADIEALVTPGKDFIDIEIVSVKKEPDKRELSAFLKLDVERGLDVLMRSMYLSEARKGHEGDTHNDRVDDF